MRSTGRTVKTVLAGVALLAVAIGESIPSFADPTDPADIRYIGMITSNYVPILKSKDDMVQRGRGIASYLSDHPDADGIATVYRNNERDGFTQTNVSMMVMAGANVYARDHLIAIETLERQYVAAHPEEAFINTCLARHSC
jgi:hypothetical protein